MRTRFLTVCSIALLFSLGGAPGIPSANLSFDELIHTIRTGNAYQRAEAVGPLSWIDDPRVVPQLVVLLGDEDARVRTYAAQQLSRLADERSADALTRALSDSAGHVRRYAAEALTKTGNERHVPALVASVMSHLPDPDTNESESWSCIPALEAIGKLSSEAPGDLCRLAERIASTEQMLDEDWWRLLEHVAGCLGQIRDGAAYEPLRKAQATLEMRRQDYRAWHAVRNALAAIDPQNMPFDRPAADILNSERAFKINADGIRQRWVLPLATLGEEAIDDLQWMLRFENEQDSGRVCVAIESLGEIGGKRAAGVLREYIEQQSALSEEDRRQKRPQLRKAMLALLTADPNEETIDDTILACQTVDSFEQEYVVHDISSASSERIPSAIKIGFCRAALLGKAELKPLGRYGARGAARLLGQLGGEQAGEILSTVLLNPRNAEDAESAAQALGLVEGYDATPALMKAFVLPRARKGTIAQALGTIADPRAAPVLRDAAGRHELAEQDRLWIVAALARLGEDYMDNARLIREALPDSLEQAEWLHDDQSIRAVADLIGTDEPTTTRAIHTLEVIGTDRAFSALVSRIELGTMTDPMLTEMLANAAARMAEELQHPSEERWTVVATITAAVRGWFVTTQIVQPEPKDRPSFETVKQDPALARKVWIAEATRRLNLAGAKVEPHLYTIPPGALSGIELLFAPELVATLERIARESDCIVSVHGKRGIVPHYDVRSLAARILTDKTGQPYTFVGADGRTHPGGWDPSKNK